MMDCLEHAGRAWMGGEMDVKDLIEALDQRILDAISAKATGETIVRLCEARAWLTNPAQAHVTSSPSSQ
jgi:hypothetical protein